ncbi:MAG: DUF4129 domain-containing protein [Streptosporangiaceae bacterium]
MIFQGEPIGRDAARELARRELEKPIYHRDRPSFVDRMLDQIQDWFRRVTPDPRCGTGSSPFSGTITLVILAALLVLVVAAVYWWMRGRGNLKGRRRALLEARPTRAADHRADAERFAAAGQWAEAIRERLRAIARDLEERVILDPRPGRTADELASEAGAVLPVDLTPGIRIFDDVWYGDRPGTAEGYHVLRDLDEAVRKARPRPMEAVAWQ